MGPHSIVLYGENLITEPLGKMNVFLSDRTFFQVNLPVSMMVYDLIKRHIPKGSTIIDAYSGIGSIGFHLADQSKQVIMIESNPESVLMANRIKDRYQYNHVEIICDQTENVMNRLSADVIITDPPRNGLMPEMVEGILKSTAQQLFYVSCDVKTLARDLKILNTQWDILKVYPVRMFPKTTEMETLVILKRKV
jgi:23S rRNA (uracil1939-C5)-methyltransferase